jgi:hypothetical protein
MTTLAPILGVLAGLLAVADTIPYVRDTLRGTTRPHRGTWLIWGVLAIVVTFSQRADGASWSLIMGCAQAVVTTLVFLLAIRRGEGGISPADLTLIAIAMGGVAGWFIADAPLVATVCVVAADLIGAALMVPKTYRDPGSETLTTFAFASLGGALAAGSVAALDPALLLYPIYYCLVNAAISGLIVYRRRVLARESVHEPSSVGNGGRLSPGRHLQLPQDVRDVDARRLDADVQSFSDLVVRATGRDELKHVALSGREAWLLLELHHRSVRDGVDPRPARQSNGRIQ